MRIGIIWKNEYPWDVRIEKIANTLLAAGNEVFILCANKNHRPQRETINGLRIIRLRSVKNGFLNKIISVPFYYNPFWIRLLGRTIREEQLQLLIVRDLPLITIGIIAKKKYGVPLILDMAENYPAMYWDRIGKGGFGAIKSWFSKNPLLMEYMEKRALRKVDHVFVVVEESAERLLKKGGNSERITVVSNTPVITEHSAAGGVKKENKLRLIYVGFIQERGLDIILRAIAGNQVLMESVEFIVVGDGHYRSALEKLAGDLNISENVRFTGWVNSKNIPEYMQNCDIGVIPHKKNAHSDTTIPNKLFDYMAESLPVLVSNPDPIKRIVEEEECGEVFEAGNIASFQKALLKMIENPDETRRMGANGFTAVQRRYNWSADSKQLLQIINKYK